jgi:hypothetical protein
MRLVVAQIAATGSASFFAFLAVACLKGILLSIMTLRVCVGSARKLAVVVAARLVRGSVRSHPAGTEHTVHCLWRFTELHFSRLRPRSD